MKVLVPNTTNSYFPKFQTSRKDGDEVDNRTTESMKDTPNISTSPPVSPNTPIITNNQTSASTTSIQMSTNDLSREENRFKTFDASWPHTFISPRVLAKTGFYYIGPHDQVRCYFCKVEVSSWENGDNEVNEHSRWSPNCPLLKRRDTSNVPLDPVSELDQLLPPVSYDVCGTYGIDRRQGAYTETPFSPSSSGSDIVENINTNSNSTTVERETQTLKHPDFPEFAIETARLRSFDEWPKTMKQKPKQLSDAGFFYTQKGDRVICFSCGGGLRDWDEQDDPWEQHALWYSKCDYLRLVKGPEYIEAVKAKFAQAQNEEQTNGGLSSSSQESVASSCSSGSSSGSSSASSTPVNSQMCSGASGDKDEQNPDNKLCESRLCKICYSSEYNTAFFPCGHVIACTKCASSVTKCPLCRKPFERVMRVFFS
ncbi:death-associated inhibitor of apoptosis 1 [Sitodiplosis mosellana]|uniref:death-associated inhibitor of apoptosis 1 n=1 Tax=Sitodiplosis mosellana TaxID=263140 RepID=UPI0024451BD3|nr:death-associated inhibitor of apoptosis 1 [Sitodiplosis mosellana]XP_055325625.1 death-associated inhibitor of apoptosis 1 [Sitodiplosis mosellana]XP_055325626.1 death-associated inhibitor of apoptosis 1 [Sitodiplosis mosellana]XP_055325628.1 death-associated inhibitor of apoptosis 1 [Sitodiplosis mosellana]XP_055325629.1 death-associated inhibitor of apoptosis 1 [Sitodiplosis mosellana]XP_055325630.1 death-associated inhibitor of apoptosis 1 [Sitodiplosis mosellana]XP_055325631.1 death-as